LSGIYRITTTGEQQVALAAAIRIISEGGVIAIPTDTVYGLAASAFNEAAIARLYQIKERDPKKSIAVLLGNPSQAREIAENFPQKAEILAKTFWPGGLTLIVSKKKSLPPNISSNEKIGIRIPDHTFIRELIRRTGPLATTSANLSGQPAANNTDDFFSMLGSQLDMTIDGGQVMGGIASTVVDCTVEPVQILREGAISKEEIEKC
jgi:L-threonylcarbamoyladenylate synthase